MATGIYKITNLINEKVYIGQSKNIEKRWNRHRTGPFNKNNKAYDTELYRSIRKNGLDKFSFEIIEECSVKELNDREKYWIKHYDSFYNGYNYTLGGDSGHTKNAEKIKEIILDLKNTTLTQKQIAENRSITEEMVQGINTGRYWKQDIEYPIRKKKEKTIHPITKSGHPKRNPHECKNCGITIYGKAIICLSCYKSKQSENIPSKEVLVNLTSKYSFEEIGRQYGVTGKAVRKWCDLYDIKKHQKYDNNGTFCKTLNIEFKTFVEAAKYLIENGYSKANDLRSLANHISKAKKSGKPINGLIFL